MVDGDWLMVIGFVIGWWRLTGGDWLCDVHLAAASEARGKKAAATKAAQQRVDNCTAPTPASTISDCDSAITEITAAIRQAEAAGGVDTSAAKQKLQSWEGELLIEATRVAASLAMHTLVFVT